MTKKCLFYFLIFLDTLRIPVLIYIYFLFSKVIDAKFLLAILITSIPNIILVLWMRWDALHRYFESERKRIFWIRIITNCDFVGLFLYFNKFKAGNWDPKDSWIKTDAPVSSGGEC
jgi:hypothetical protein